MNRRAQISPWQAAVLLFSGRMLSFFLSPAGSARPSPITFCLLLLPAAVLGGMLVLPACRLLKNYPGQDLLSASAIRWGKTAKLLSLSFFLLAQAVTVQTVSTFSSFLNASAYPEASPWLFILLLTAAAAYGAYMGHEPVARFGSFVFAALTASLFFVALHLIPQLQWESVLPPAYDTAKEVIGLLIALTAGNAELAVLLFLLPTVCEKAGSVYSRWCLLWVPAMAGAVLFTAAALGDYADTQRFPFFTVTKIAGTTLFQRLDSLHIALWVFLAVIRLALFLQMSSACLKQLLGPKCRSYTVWISAGLSAAAAGILSSHGKGLTTLSSILSGGLPVLFCCFFLPLLLLLFGRKGGGIK